MIEFRSRGICLTVVLVFFLGAVGGHGSFIFAWQDGSTGPAQTQQVVDPAVRSRFLQDVASLAALKPDYLNLGAEINLLYYLNKTEFANYQTL